MVQSFFLVKQWPGHDASRRVLPQLCAPASAKYITCGLHYVVDHPWSVSPTLLWRADGKTFKKPRRPYEKERLDAELKLVGEYGLRNKRELWRVQMQLSKIRNAARTLLTLEERDPRRIFQGNALLKRMYRYGLLDESQKGLDYVLALQPSDFLERRLQTLVFKLGHAKSIHHARVLIRQRHIRCDFGRCDQSLKPM